QCFDDWQLEITHLPVGFFNGSRQMLVKPFLPGHLTLEMNDRLCKTSHHRVVAESSSRITRFHWSNHKVANASDIVDGIETQLGSHNIRSKLLSPILPECFFVRQHLRLD